MASSLSPECTPLKIQYDACFNSWFEGYLEPAVAASSSLSPKQRQEYSKRKAEEYERKCGGVWKEYKECVMKAVKDSGLESVLQQARDEHPITSPPPPAPSSHEHGKKH